MLHPRHILFHAQISDVKDKTDTNAAEVARLQQLAGELSEKTDMAIDKASGVASVAAGILKGRVGNLTSAVALKVTLMGVLAKTERKRQSYGKGIADISRLILLTLDKTGVYPNKVDERDIEIHWSSPLPENVMEKLQEANMKKELGVPQERILEELGY